MIIILVDAQGDHQELKISTVPEYIRYLFIIW